MVDFGTLQSVRNALQKEFRDFEDIYVSKPAKTNASSMILLEIEEIWEHHLDLPNLPKGRVRMKASAISSQNTKESIRFGQKIKSVMDGCQLPLEDGHTGVFRCLNSVISFPSPKTSSCVEHTFDILVR